MKTFVTRALFCWLLSLLLAESFLLTSAAQETAPSNPPAAPQASPTDQSKDAQDDKKTSDQATSKDRLFFALPNFLTLENAGNVPPLTVGQKFKVVARGSFDYIQIPWYAALAGISQAENSEPGYGQGAEGYGKRFGSAAADGTIENFMTSAILPSLLHQDPRFFQESEGDFGIEHDTQLAASLSLAPIPGISNSTFLRFAAARRRLPFPPTATIPAPIALCRTPPVFGGRR